MSNDFVRSENAASLAISIMPLCKLAEAIIVKDLWKYIQNGFNSIFSWICFAPGVTIFRKDTKH